MQVGAKLSFGRLALHRGDHLVADDEATDVGAAGLLDVLLHHDVGLHAHEGLDHRLGGLVGLGQHHADALGALQQLDDQRCALDHGDQVGNVVRRVSEAGDRQAQALARKQLQRAQLVPRAGDGDRVVENVSAHHLELAQHGAAVEGDRRPDTGDHRIEALDLLSLVVNRGVMGGNAHVAAQGIDDPHLVAALFGGFHQASRGVEVAIA